ncbi:MAG TPA: alpha-amylase family glycosyl hydrolase [Candidatus Limnocylindrales bacterium]|nr:alpha-amylase family glycosyl hydrolase [Candidatus Limnocylindrales bacterium]
MPILARPRRRRWAALAIVAGQLLTACGPAPSGVPSPTAPAGSPTAGPSANAVATGAPGSACVPAQPAPSHDWNERVWYELFVRSFADGNGDGTGDFRGLTAKLDYLNDGDPATTTDLGIGGIWLMPIMQSPSYHGYDVVDYRTVERSYGTNADFKAFLAAAHKRGIKVIIDLVLNHTSSSNPWFIDAVAGGPHHDWYVWSKTALAWPSPTGSGNPWHPASNGQWYYGVFSDSMPDLNLRNADATAAVTDMARFWLHDMGVDGFRLDAARHLIEDGPQAQVNTPETHAWLATFKQAIDAVKPEAVTVGEVWDLSRNAGSYVPNDTDLTFDFGLSDAVGTALRADDASPIQSAMGQTLASWPANQEASFLTNHDEERIMSELAGDVPAAKLAAFMLFSEPGVPFVYYGEEIGMLGQKPDEQIRTPMPWTGDAPAGGFSTATPWEPLGDGWQTANVAAETGDPKSLLSTYRSLIALRSSSPALRDGTTTVVDGGSHPVIGWLRTTPDETLLAVVNVSAKPVDAYGLTLAVGPLCGPMTATLLSTVGGDATAAIAPVTVNRGGGLTAYRPVATLAPRSGYLFRLTAAR